MQNLLSGIAAARCAQGTVYYLAVSTKKVRGPGEMAPWLKELLVCGVLNENAPPPPPQAQYLNVWFTVDGTVWEGVGGVAPWGEVCHCSWALMFQKLKQLFVNLLRLLLTDLRTTPEVCLPGCCHSPHRDGQRL